MWTTPQTSNTLDRAVQRIAIERDQKRLVTASEVVNSPQLIKYNKL